MVRLDDGKQIVKKKIVKTNREKIVKKKFVKKFTVLHWICCRAGQACYSIWDY